MKVLHVIPGLARRYGGPSTVITALCSALAKQHDLEVELTATDADGPSHCLAPHELSTDYPVHLCRRTATEQWKYSRTLGKWLRANAGRFDVVHIHGLWSYASAAAARAARRANVPYIVRPAGMLSAYSFRDDSWKKRVYWQLIEHKTVSRAAALHATSSAEKVDIQCVHPAARVHVIPNGVEDAAWDGANIPVQPERVGLSHGAAPVVLFLSRLHPKKGLTDLLLPAFARMRRDATLIIAGGPDAHAPGYEHKVRATIVQLGLQSRVTLLGPVSPDLRWGLYDSAAVFVLPSHSENFGVVVAEAMARACPVIVTDAVQCCEHVTAACAGMVVAREAEELSRAMDEMVSKPALRRQLGLNGQEYAAKHFQWDRVAASVRQMYEVVLRGGATASSISSETTLRGSVASV
ncbi:MAG TPA: glycosyltransferase [Lacipirellula sp.]